MEIKNHNANVYDHTGKWVSGATVEPGWSTEQILEEYAKGCGWGSAAAMREHYPIDEFTFVTFEMRAD